MDIWKTHWENHNITLHIRHEVKLFSRCSLFVSFCWLLVTFHSYLVSFGSLPVTFCWLHVTFCSLFVTFCLVVDTFCSLLVTFCPLLVTFFTRCSTRNSKRFFWGKCKQNVLHINFYKKFNLWITWKLR